MVFSDTTNLTGLVQDTDFICGTDDTSYPIKDKTRNINRHYYVAVSDMLQASGRVEFHDSNYTTLPRSTFDLVDGQAVYAKPTDFLKLNAVEIKDNGGNWVRLQPLDTSDLKSTITDVENTPGVPKYYDDMGGNIVLYPAPATGSVTLTAGGKLHYSKEVDGFSADDTTQEPGFAEPFHRILSLGAAYDYLVINDSQDKSDRVLGAYEKMRMDLRKHYADINRDDRVAFRPATRTANYL